MPKINSEYQKDAEEYYGLLRQVHSAAFTTRARQNAETTEERYESEEYPAIRNLNTFVEMLHLLLGDGPEISGVDFGCGSHFFVDMVRRKYSWNARGYDPDATAIAEAKEKYPESRDAYFVYNPLQQGLPLPDVSQDFVFCNAVLQHFSDEEANLVLQEMARVLRKEGVCLLIFKRNVEDWQAVSSQKGLKVEVLEHASGKVLLEDKTMKNALANLDERAKAKLPEHYRNGMRLFHVFSIEEVCQLATKHGLQAKGSVRLPDRSKTRGIFRYFSGKGIPTAAVFLVKQMNEHDLDILWEYRNHQEELLYQRINVFLIAQSMLFVAYTEAKDGLIPGAISFLGTVTTILGWFSVIRQRFVFQFARDYVKDKVTAHGELQKERKKEEDKYWFHRHFAGQELLCFSLPLLMLLVWLGLVINSIRSISRPLTLLYIALGLVILLVVLLPAFRGKSLKSKEGEQKSDKGVAAGNVKAGTK